MADALDEEWWLEEKDEDSGNFAHVNYPDSFLYIKIANDTLTMNFVLRKRIKGRKEAAKRKVC